MGPHQVTLPANVRRVLSYLRFGISLGFSDTASFLTCIGVGGYHWQLILWMLVPPVLICAILVSCIAYLLQKRRLSRIALLETALPLVVKLLFLLYPLIATVAFEAFSCYPAFEDGTRYLIADVAVQCFTQEPHEIVWPEAYTSIWTTAWWAVGVYAFGLLTLNATLLFSAREAILKRKPTPLSHAIRFLYREYGAFLLHLFGTFAAWRPGALMV